MEISLFKNSWDTAPKRVTMEAVVEMMRTDAFTRERTLAYREQRHAQLKKQCRLFGPAALFESGKGDTNVVALTGVAMVDLDHVVPADNASAAETLARLRATLAADEHTLLCHTTVSGEGLRVLYRYELTPEATEATKPEAPKTDTDALRRCYAAAFAAGNAYYARLAGCPADGQCKNMSRLSIIAHDPEVFYNPGATPFTAEWVAREAEAAFEQAREQKRRELAWRRQLKLIQARYDQVVRPEVEAEGAVYAPGSHNDYVMRVGYKLNALGVSGEAAVAWATATFADYAEAGAVVRSCFARTEEHGSRRRVEAGRAGAREIQAFLADHARLRHNVITARVEVQREENGAWVPLTDRVVNSLWTEMSATQRVNPMDMYRVIESDFVEDFHPFRAYLEGVAGSDGAIARLAQTVTVRGGEEEQRLWEEYLRRWMVGMVAAWVDDTVVNNVILVLIGEQGAYKTTWFNYLLPPALRRYFYTKTNANRMGRDDLLTLAQYGLICCEELDTMRAAELNQLKAAVTMPTIDERAAYAHFHEHRQHIASFCATGNNVQFLSDPTGNRRWLPFEVEAIRSPREQPFDYDAIYGEAYALYRSGYRFWFTREEIVALSRHNRQFETPRLEVELVQQYFRHPAEGERGEFMSVAHALQVVGGAISQKLSPVYMGRAFCELGFEKRVVNNVRGYVVVRYTAEEMAARRRVAGIQ